MKARAAWLCNHLMRDCDWHRSCVWSQHRQPLSGDLPMNTFAKVFAGRSLLPAPRAHRAPCSLSRTAFSLCLPVIAALAAALGACGGDNSQPSCQPSSTAQAVAELCAPTSIASGQALRLQVREQCGGCTQRATRCEAVVQGQELKLRLLGESCTLPTGSACPAICAINTFDCSVPPLAAGTYRVSTENGTSTVVMMTASPTVSATSCTLP